MVTIPQYLVSLNLIVHFKPDLCYLMWFDYTCKCRILQNLFRLQTSLKHSIGISCLPGTVVTVLYLDILLLYDHFLLDVHVFNILWLPMDLLYILVVHVRFILFFAHAIYNGNRTEWRPVQSVIIQVITKSDYCTMGVQFVNHKYDYRQNWVKETMGTG